MKRNVVFLFMLAVIAACAHKFPVNNYGKDKTGNEVYAVTVDSFSLQKAENAAFKTANEHCQNMGLKMYPIKKKYDSWMATVYGGSQGTKHNINLFFNCLKE